MFLTCKPNSEIPSYISTMGVSRWTLHQGKEILYGDQLGFQVKFPLYLFIIYIAEMRIRAFWSEPDPGFFFQRLDPDPVLSRRSDPDPGFLEGRIRVKPTWICNEKLSPGVLDLKYDLGPQKN